MNSREAILIISIHGVEINRMAEKGDSLSQDIKDTYERWLKNVEDQDTEEALIIKVEEWLNRLMLS